MTHRIVFAGTPEFSVPVLEALLNAEVDVVGVFTQPDRKAGRGKKIQQSPVKQRALQAGVDVFQPENFRSAEAQRALADLEPDLMVVVAYGLILPQKVLDIPTVDCVNVHASLLPRWRGAAPIQRSIEAGDAQTGVCLMRMEKGLDTGPVFACAKTLVEPEDTGGSLHDRLAQMGADLLAEALNSILAQSLIPEPQSTEGISYANKLSKDETRIDWSDSAQAIANKIRAFNPWPVAVAEINGKAVRIHSAEADDSQVKMAGVPGEIIGMDKQRVVVQAGKGVVALKTLQKPGGKVLAVQDFLNGFPLALGDCFV